MKNILNIAHRGYTRDFPDNTLEAFKAALDLGVDGVEFDVQETRDVEFIIHHDDDLAGKPIAAQKLADLRQERIQDKYLIPILQETLDLLNNKLVLIVELKQVKSLEKFLEILRSHVMIDKVVLVSFNPELISGLARLAPDIMRAVITGEPTDDSMKIARATHSGAIGVHYSYLTSELILRAHADNLIVFVWGCTDTQSVRQALQFDIDGIISDFPDVVKGELVIK